MLSDERQLREIEAGERWLAGVCVDPPGPDPERLRQHVRVALAERWLRESPNEPTPEDLADRTKTRVREALAAAQADRHVASSAGPRPQAYRVVRWAWGTGLAAAACVAVYVGLPQQTSGGMVRTDSFLSYTYEDFDLSLATFDDQLDDLEVALTQADDDRVDDELLDDLLDAVDEVTWEELDGSDWTFDETG